MPKTSHESQDTPATPLPAGGENAPVSSEAEQEAELGRVPSPNTSTNPSIKNN